MLLVKANFYRKSMPYNSCFSHVFHVGVNIKWKPLPGDKRNGELYEILTKLAAYFKCEVKQKLNTYAGI